MHAQLTDKQIRELLEDGDLEETLAYCRLNTSIFAKVFYPERFFRPWSGNHERLFEALDDEDISRLVVIAHRGIGKTSILNLAYPAKTILFRMSRFIVEAACSEAQAIMQSDGLKMSLLTNETITKLFGHIKPDSRDTTFSKHLWKALDTYVLPRGSTQQFRGFIAEGYRPDLVMLDDFEDPEAVANEDRRAKVRNTFYNDIMNMVDLGDTTASGRPNYRFLILGTLLHEDALLQNLKDDSRWTVVELPLCDENFKSYWPAYMSDERVLEKVQEEKEKGNLDGFYREFMGIPIATENRSFRSEFYRYYNENEYINKDFPETVVLVDPAKTVNMRSAESGIVVIGIGAQKNTLRFRYAEGIKASPDQLISKVFDLALRYGAQHIAVEVTSLENWIKHPFINEMVRRGLSFEFHWMKAKGKKEERARELVYYYRNRLIEHAEGAVGALEAQELMFPNNKRWDVLDAAAYIVPLLEEGGIYMLPQYEDDEAEEKAYQKLLAADEEPEVGWEIL